MILQILSSLQVSLSPRRKRRLWERTQAEPPGRRFFVFEKPPDLKKKFGLSFQVSDLEKKFGLDLAG